MMKSAIEMKRLLFFSICFVFLASCGGGGGGGSSSQAVSGVLISPRPLAIQKGNTLRLTAKDLSGQMIPPSSLTWNVDGTAQNGTIDSNGVYTAPANIPPQSLVTVRAASVLDPAKNDALSFYTLTGPVLNFATSVDQSTTLPMQKGSSKFQVAAFNTNLYVAWITTDQSNVTHLWYSKGGKNGVFSAPHDILSDITTLPGFNLNGTVFENPVIALDNKVDSNGDPGVYIVWDDSRSSNYQIYFVRGPDGKSCGTTPCFEVLSATINGQIDPSPGLQQYPSIAISPLGKIEFAWTQVYSSPQCATDNLITYKELNADGSVAKPSVRVSSSCNPPTLQSNPQIAVDFSGNISVAWTEHTATTLPSIFYARLPAGQPNFGSSIPVETDPLSTNDTFSMTLDYQGHPYLAWSNSYHTQGTPVYYASTTDFANFQAPVKKLTSNGLNPTIKVDMLDNLYFTWNDSNSVYFDKFSSSGTPSSSPLNVVTGLNPAMDIDIAGRVYLLFSLNLSTFFLSGE